jgi:UDP:flavonoid glycosyltransferase YjiC (YdhE family)
MRGRLAFEKPGVPAEATPLVALSFSTTEMHGQMELVERLCSGLVDQPIDAVLTLGGLSHIPITPRRNVEVVPFADHDELFPRCEAVVTHGGLGTVLRALAHGVPLLMLPLGRDQHVNAGQVAQLGPASPSHPMRRRRTSVRRSSA